MNGRAILLAACLMTLPLLAQRGAGAPGVYISSSTGMLGGTLTVDLGYPGLAGAPVLLSLSDGYGPTNFPLIGQVWLDTTSPAYAVFGYTTDGLGNARIQVPLPVSAALFNAPPIFANALVVDPIVGAPGWGLSKTIRIQFDTVDGYRPAGTMLEPRANHTATLMAADERDNVSEVLIAGGGIGSIIIPVPSQTTEIWSALTRSFRPGPLMGLPRIAHSATRLQDGRILICGGITSGGLATDSCELFDPISESFSPAAPMTALRSGHRATLLPDGRVLVTGGVSDWTDAANNFVARLNTAQDTAEIYDPVTANWTPVATSMNSKRLGHEQLLMDDGRVFLIGGVNGGAVTGQPGQTGNVPTHTGFCEFFDPATDSFSSAPSLLQPRGYHAASLTPNGEVIVSGGSITGPGFPTTGGAAVATDTVEFWDGSAWSFRVGLPQAVAFHSQVTSEFNGDAIVLGGFVGDFTQLAGSEMAARHNGVAVGNSLPLGLHPLVPGTAPLGRGTFRFTRLQDGAYLLTGGASWPATFADAYTLVDLQ